MTSAIAAAALLAATVRSAGAPVCPTTGVRLSRVAVEGVHAAPYTLALPTLDACVASCNSSQWCRAVVFKGVGATGIGKVCGAANTTCCCE